MYFDYIQLPLLQDPHLPPQPLPTLFSLSFSLCLLILICAAHVIIGLELSTEEAHINTQEAETRGSSVGCELG